MAALLCVSAMMVNAQSSDNEDQVVKIDQANHRAHRAGEVLVKFKDNSSVVVKKQSTGRMRASSAPVQNILQRLGVSDMEQLMPVGGKIKVPERLRARRANGQPVEDRDLSKLYLVKFDTHLVHNVNEAVNALKQLEEVEFAEPNYIVYALSSPATDGVQQVNNVSSG